MKKPIDPFSLNLPSNEQHLNAMAEHIKEQKQAERQEIFDRFSHIENLLRDM